MMCIVVNSLFLLTNFKKEDYVSISSSYTNENE